MAYFSKIPNLLYLKYTKNPYDGQWITIKNIFSRIKLVDKVKDKVTVFDDYTIEDGSRQILYHMIYMVILVMIGLYY